MGQPVTDEELKLRKRARRRLVGATALVLIAVLILPWFVDDKPPPPLKNVEIVIPPVQPVDEKFPKELPPPAGEPLPAELDPETEPRAKAPDATARDAQEAPVTSQGLEPGAAPLSSADTRPPAPAKTAREHAVNVAKPPPATKPPVPKSDQTAASTSTSTKGYVIRLGAYSSKDNARQLLAKVRAAGFPGYTEPVRTTEGTKTRVRGGPYSSLEAAEKARTRMAAMKLGIGDLKVVQRGQ